MMFRRGELCWAGCLAALILWLGATASTAGYDVGLLDDATYDPSFEGPERWQYTATGSTYGSTTDPAQEGSKTFRSTSSTLNYSGRTLESDEFIFDVAGDRDYRLEAAWFASGSEWADNRLELNIDWYDASEVFISTSTVSDLSLSAQDTWELKRLDTTSPSNAAEAKIVIHWKRTTGTTSGRQQSFDRIALIASGRPNVPTLVSPINGAETENIFPVFSWNHNDTDGSPQAKYNLQIASDLGFSDLLFEDTATTTETQMRITNALPTPNDTDLFWRVRTSNQGDGLNGAADTFSDFSTVGMFLLNNLIANPSFEKWYGPLVGDDAESWLKLNSTASNHVRSANTPNPPSGETILQFKNLNLTFDRGVENDTNNYFIFVQPGQGYRFGGAAQKNTGLLPPSGYAVRFQVDWFNEDDQLITTSTYQDTFSGFNIWEKFDGETIVAPIDASKAKFRVQGRRNGGSSSPSDQINIDDVYLRAAGEPSEFTDDTSVVGQVIINEIMWDGAEYIELKNVSASAINIGGWKMYVGGDPEFAISDGATLGAGDFYLIADNGAVSFTPDQTSSMTLLQDGEFIELKTINDVLIDAANQNGPWFAGANNPVGVAMARIDSSAGTTDTNWADALGRVGGRNGTPGQENLFIYWYVNDENPTSDSHTTSLGNDGYHGRTPSAPKRTIGAAMGEIRAGDTIFVDAGTYNELVTFGADSVSIIGVDSSVTTIDWGDSESGTALRAVNRSGLVVRDLEIRNVKNGLIWSGTDSSIIERLKVHQVKEVGICLDLGSDRNTIVGNYVADASVNNFYILFDSNENMLFGNTAGGSINSHGFTIQDSDSNIVIGNHAENLINASGFFSRESNGTVFRKNEVRGNSLQGIFLFKANNGEVTHNVVRGSIGTALVIDESDNNRIEQNDFRSDSQQLHLKFGAKDNLITKNNFRLTDDTSTLLVDAEEIYLPKILERNYWGTADSGAIVVRVSISGGDTYPVDFIPFRLGPVDTTTGADTVAPEAPATVTATRLSETAAKIAWSTVIASEENEGNLSLSGYNIYRSTTRDTTNWELIHKQSDLEPKEFVDSTISPAETPYYRITAYDNASPHENQSYFSFATPRPVYTFGPIEIDGDNVYFTDGNGNTISSFIRPPQNVTVRSPFSKSVMQFEIPNFFGEARTISIYDQSGLLVLTQDFGRFRNAALADDKKFALFNDPNTFYQSVLFYSSEGIFLAHSDSVEATSIRGGFLSDTIFVVFHNKFPDLSDFPYSDMNLIGYNPIDGSQRFLTTISKDEAFQEKLNFFSIDATNREILLLLKNRNSGAAKKYRYDEQGGLIELTDE